MSLQLTENDDIVRTNRNNLWNGIDAKQSADIQQQSINQEKAALLAR